MVLQPDHDAETDIYHDLGNTDKRCLSNFLKKKIYDKNLFSDNVELSINQSNIYFTAHKCMLKNIYTWLPM